MVTGQQGSNTLLTLRVELGHSFNLAGYTLPASLDALICTNG